MKRGVTPPSGFAAEHISDGQLQGAAPTGEEATLPALAVHQPGGSSPKFRWGLLIGASSWQ